MSGSHDIFLLEQLPNCSLLSASNYSFPTFGIFSVSARLMNSILVYLYFLLSNLVKGNPIRRKIPLFQILISLVQTTEDNLFNEQIKEGFFTITATHCLALTQCSVNVCCTELYCIPGGSARDSAGWHGKLTRLTRNKTDLERLISMSQFPLTQRQQLHKTCMPGFSGRMNGSGHRAMIDCN